MADLMGSGAIDEQYLLDIAKIEALKQALQQQYGNKSILTPEMIQEEIEEGI